MKAKVLVFGILIFLNIKNCFNQEWVRIYGGSLNTIANKVFEHYDNGFIFSGMQYDNSYHPNAWLQKTDANGLVLWQKYFGVPQKYYNFFGSDKTEDGGIIGIGMTDILQSNCKDPIIVKINSCGEKEWCRIYNAPGCNAVGQDIRVTMDGYIALVDGWKSGDEQVIWLFRLDSLGEVIWAQVYANDPVWNSEWSHSLLKTTDSCYVITGEAYYPDPTYPNKKIIKIILIKVDLDGNSIFEVPWGTNNGIYSKGYQSIEDSKHLIYTAGEHPRTSIPGGDSPCIFKTDSKGEPIAYFDLLNTSTKGISTTINWLQDSSIILGCKWGYPSGVDTIGVFKTDYFGTVVKAKTLLTALSGTLQSSGITFNNKTIFSGSFYNKGYWLVYAFKLTADLEFDSLYTTPLTYDSLCDHPIVSDTIPLDDCEVVVVSIDEALKNPETTKLHVYPNPANEQVTIEMPKFIVRLTGGQVDKNKTGFGISATTIYYQWNTSTLEIYNLFGKLMYSKEIPKKTERIELEVDSWNGGMYVVRVVYMQDIVASAKFVIKIK